MGEEEAEQRIAELEKLHQEAVDAHLTCIKRGAELEQERNKLRDVILNTSKGWNTIKLTALLSEAREALRPYAEENAPYGMMMPHDAITANQKAKAVLTKLEAYK